MIDTSALLAILFGEPEADAMVRAIVRDPVRRVGTPNVVEAALVMLARKGPGGEVALDALIERLDLEVVPLTVAASKLARLAYANFGRGVGDPGVLNYGDCLGYGVAAAEREPLLFKGHDFSKTDVHAVEYR